nr:MAG TPA: hypothetical protein [Caudoviricetes sp.]
MKPSQIMALKALKRISWEYPNIFEMIDNAVESSNPKITSPWDKNLVYAPAILVACTSFKNKGRAAILRHPFDLPLITALAGWRKAKTVYDFSPALADELIKSAQSEEISIPMSALALPYWAIYIKPNIKKWDIDGFFVYYNEGIPNKNGKNIKELRFTPLSKDGDALPTIYLVQNEQKDICIKDAITAILNKVNIAYIHKAHYFHRFSESSGKELGKIAAQMISLVLYLSTVNADMKRDPTQPFKRTKHVLDIAREVEHIHVGDEVAIHIKEMRKHHTARTVCEPLGGHHRPPVTHVRRAHWHAFRIGKGRKKIMVKWLAPTVVNADGEQKNIVTINKVDE